MSPGIELGTSRTEGRALTVPPLLLSEKWPFEFGLRGTDKNAMLGGKKPAWLRKKSKFPNKII